MMYSISFSFLLLLYPGHCQILLCLSPQHFQYSSLPFHSFCQDDSPCSGNVLSWPIPHFLISALVPTPSPPTPPAPPHSCRPSFPVYSIAELSITLSLTPSSPSSPSAFHTCFFSWICPLSPLASPEFLLLCMLDQYPGFNRGHTPSMEQV